MSGMCAEVNLGGLDAPAVRRGEVRFDRLLARVRHRQLESALVGRFHDSARYAGRARRVRAARGCGRPVIGLAS